MVRNYESEEFWQMVRGEIRKGRDADRLLARVWEHVHSNTGYVEQLPERLLGELRAYFHIDQVD